MCGFETWMLRIQEHQRSVAYHALHGEVRKNREMRERWGTAATLLIGNLSSIRNLRTRQAVVTGTHYMDIPSGI